MPKTGKRSRSSGGRDSSSARKRAWVSHTPTSTRASPRSNIEQDGSDDEITTGLEIITRGDQGAVDRKHGQAELVEALKKISAKEVDMFMSSKLRVIENKTPQQFLNDDKQSNRADRAFDILTKMGEDTQANSEHTMLLLAYCHREKMWAKGLTCETNADAFMNRLRKYSAIRNNVILGLSALAQRRGYESTLRTNWKEGWISKFDDVPLQAVIPTKTLQVLASVAKDHVDVGTVAAKVKEQVETRLNAKKDAMGKRIGGSSCNTNYLIPDDVKRAYGIPQRNKGRGRPAQNKAQAKANTSPGHTDPETEKTGNAAADEGDNRVDRDISYGETVGTRRPVPATNSIGPPQASVSRQRVPAGPQHQAVQAGEPEQARPVRQTRQAAETAQAVRTPPVQKTRAPQTGDIGPSSRPRPSTSRATEARAKRSCTWDPPDSLIAVWGDYDPIIFVGQYGDDIRRSLDVDDERHCGWPKLSIMLHDFMKNLFDNSEWVFQKSGVCRKCSNNADAFLKQMSTIVDTLLAVAGNGEPHDRNCKRCQDGDDDSEVD